MDLDLVVIVTG